METWMLVAAAAAGIAALLLFNVLIGKKNGVEFALASVDAQLKKRFDLIPNLVSSCEKYMGYEQAVLKDLTVTRTKVMSGSEVDWVALDGKLSSQLRSVFALAENYPDLKAAETFTLLQRSLNEVEEQLAASRRAFNAAVTSYNNALEMFPTNMLARLLGYQRRAWFEATAEEREPVRVWR